MNRRERQKLIMNIFTLFIILGMVIYFLNHSLKDILLELSHTNPLLLGVIFLLGMFYQLLEGTILRILILPINPFFSIKDGIFASCYTAFYRIISFGVATVPAEITYYHKKGLTYSEGMGITTLRMVIYKLSILFIAIFSLGLHFFLRAPIKTNVLVSVFFGCILTFFIVTTLLTLSFSVYLQTWIMMLLNRWVNNPAWRIKIDSFNLSIYALREMILSVTKSKSLLFTVSILSILKISCWYIIPIVYFFYEGYTISGYELYLMISFTTIVAGVIPAPAGIGSFEFVYLLLFKPVFGTVETISSLLLYRSATYFLPFFIGCLYVLVMQRRAISKKIQIIKEEK